MTERFDSALRRFTAALAQFDEIVATPREKAYIVDAAIQRFEFTVEAAWKAMAGAAEAEGLPAAGPRMALESALKLGLVEDDGAWAAIMKDRNLSTHTYNRDLAEELYGRLPTHLAHFQKLAENLSAFSAKLPDAE